MASQEQPQPDPSTAAEIRATSSPPLMLPRTLKGSCHCSYITYTTDIELPMRPHLPRATRCNCRICLKSGFTAFALPNGKKSFHLSTPSSLNDDGIADRASISKLDNREVHRYFCKGCGVTVCAGGHYTIKPAQDVGVTEGDEGKAEGGKIRSQPSQEEHDPAPTPAVSSPSTTTTSEPVRSIPRMPFSTAARIVSQTSASLRRVRAAQQQRASESAVKSDLSPPIKPDAEDTRATSTSASASAATPEKDKSQGETVHFFTINLVTIDQPQEGVDLSVWKIEYYDGRNDNWMAGNRAAPWNGGIV